MDIAYLHDHPEELNQDTLYELRQLVAAYPTFHSARILFLRNLYLLHDTSFDQELRRAALLVPDRSMLFEITQNKQLIPISEPEFGTEERLESTTESKAEKADTLKEESEALTSTFAHNGISEVDGGRWTPSTPTTPQRGGVRKKFQQGDSTSELLDGIATTTATPLKKRRTRIDPSTDYMAYLLQSETEGESTFYAGTSGSIPENRMDALIDGFIGSHNERIVLSENPMMPEDIIDEPVNPAQEEATAITPANDKPANAPTNAAITAPKTDSTPNPTLVLSSALAAAKASNESEETDASFTETLANIYIKQQKYDRAIEVLVKLKESASVRNNPYYEDQLRFLQKLAINKRHRKP